MPWTVADKHLNLINNSSGVVRSGIINSVLAVVKELYY